ncbi:uncharacterized protein [Argopecten irradians]|uniref:uncharacterized protein isoform X2 n=1 Tax=Argopecten irradians TaxID=31199 RepID=UPI00371313B2
MTYVGMGLLLLILNIISLITQGLTLPPSCFSCSSISHARYCDFRTRCGEGEVCFVEKTETSPGHFKYTSGCIHNTMCGNGTYDTRSSSSGFGVCRECCYGDMCNNKGCGDDGPPKNRGPYCFQCDHLSDPSECDQVTICNVDEVCSVNEREFFQEEHEFFTGCQRRSQCHESLIFGRAVKSVNLCRRCCESDLCNDRCTENELTTTTSALTTTTSTTQTTPTSTATTTLTARIYRNCDEYYRAGSVKSGIYTISPDDVTTFDVYCDMEDGDGGWIVLQHRFNGSVLFNRSFSDYENGFGQLDGEFWLGLSKMYLLTNSNRIVRFNLQTLTGTWLTLEYGTFSVASNRTQYTLHVANHIKGFGAQTFEYNSGNEFSTIDRDNGNSCAKRRFGGWWYKSCTYLNINGEFGLADNESGVMEHYTYNYLQFQKTLMMIK